MSKTEDLSLKERIYSEIRDRILSLRLAPGDKIPESALADEFGVSRPIVREAVQRLSWDGLIKLEPNRSATVIVMDSEMIQELALVRWQHDQLAIPLAIYNSSQKNINELRKLANACIEANDRGDLIGRHAYDADFHDMIYRLSGNQLLCSLQARLNMLIRLWQAMYISSPDMLADGLRHHLDLTDAFEARDVPGALRIIHKHSTVSFGTDYKGVLLTPQDIVELR